MILRRNQLQCRIKGALQFGMKYWKAIAIISGIFFISTIEGVLSSHPHVTVLVIATILWRITEAVAMSGKRGSRSPRIYKHFREF